MSCQFKQQQRQSPSPIVSQRLKPGRQERQQAVFIRQLQLRRRQVIVASIARIPLDRESSRSLRSLLSRTPAISAHSPLPTFPPNSLDPPCPLPPPPPPFPDPPLPAPTRIISCSLQTCLELCWIALVIVVFVIGCSLSRRIESMRASCIGAGVQLVFSEVSRGEDEFAAHPAAQYAEPRTVILGSRAPNEQEDFLHSSPHSSSGKTLSGPPCMRNASSSEFPCPLLMSPTSASATTRSCIIAKEEMATEDFKTGADKLQWDNKEAPGEESGIKNVAYLGLLLTSSSSNESHAQNKEFTRTATNSPGAVQQGDGMLLDKRTGGAGKPDSLHEGWTAVGEPQPEPLRAVSS
ncbi:unnamed protein product [Closterium sp. NIES-54]